MASDSYCDLESMDIYKCNKLVTVFPYHMVGMFKKLESLVVQLSSVEVIFDIGDNPPVDPEKDTCLRKLNILLLKNLKHIWSRDPEGILNFKSLRDVQVSHCHKINNLFPFSVASDLQQLESLCIWHCKGIEQIVCGEYALNAYGVMFEFPEPTSVTFGRLPKLRSLYPGIHNIEWPQLKNISLYDCDNMLVFTKETSNPERLPILSGQVIRNLQCLELGNTEVDLLLHCIDDYHLNSVKTLHLSVLKNPEFLLRLLHRTPNLEKLNLSGCEFKELLLHPGMLTATEKIEQDPALPQQLQKLTIEYCNHLINLALDMICFNHLTYLKVQYCGALINLMESFTAKSLSQLTTLEISFCSAMEEIVSKKESRDESEDKISFHKLTTLNLIDLQVSAALNIVPSCSPCWKGWK